MITPLFEITQDFKLLYIKIRAPYAKVSETEIEYHESSFLFYSNPYYLRLHLPGQVQQSDGEKASYDCDSGWFTICIPKANPGEHFTDLDMLTKLLKPCGRERAEPLIEVVREEGECSANSDVDDDWFLKQEIAPEVVELNGPKYGFGNRRSGVFKTLREELNYAIDVKNPDCVCLQEKKIQRHKQEEEKFSNDYYLADLYEDATIQEILQFQPKWYSFQKNEMFTDEEKETMRNLPRREYLLDSTTLNTTVLSLVDIIYAYAYNHRSTMGDNTVESCWTICKLSATLSWLETFSTLPEVIQSCFRRALCIPLYRHWGLSQKVLQDIKAIFTKGRKYILKCLLEIHQLLKVSDNFYILNDLYITDYCVWLQTISDKTLEPMSQDLEELIIAKKDVGFDLEELEFAGKLAVAEECGNSTQMQQLTQAMAVVSVSGTIQEVNSSAEESSDETSDESSTSEDTSTLDSDDTDCSCPEHQIENDQESKKSR